MSLTVRNEARTAPTAGRRLLHGLSAGTPDPGLATHLDRWGDLRLRERRLVDELEASGLVGHGGAWFPVSTKWKAVAGASRRRPVVIANGAEGEPASRKDALLLTHAPHLVLDGLALAAGALRAQQAIVYAPASRIPRDRSRSRRTTRSPPRSDRHRDRGGARHLHIRPGVRRRQRAQRAPRRHPLLRRIDVHPRARGGGSANPGPERRDARPRRAHRPLRRSVVPGGRHAREPGHDAADRQPPGWPGDRRSGAGLIASPGHRPGPGGPGWGSRGPPRWLRRSLGVTEACSASSWCPRRQLGGPGRLSVREWSPPFREACAPSPRWRTWSATWRARGPDSAARASTAWPSWRTPWSTWPTAQVVGPAPIGSSRSVTWWKEEAPAAIRTVSPGSCGAGWVSSPTRRHRTNVEGVAPRHAQRECSRLSTGSRGEGW